MTEIRAPYDHRGPIMSPECTGSRHPECAAHVRLDIWALCLCDCHRDDLPLCRGCQTRGMREALVLSREGVPDSHPDHTMVYFHWVYRSCGRCGHGELEFLDHDCFGAPNDPDEPWDLDDHYPLAPADAERLGALIREVCPQPLDPECGCSLHGSLRASLRDLPHAGYSKRSRVHQIRLSPVGEPVRFLPPPPAPMD